MNLLSMPMEVKREIITSIEPLKITRKEIKYYGRVILNLSLTAHDLNDLFCAKLQDLKKIYHFAVKYYEYEKSYEEANLEENPHLYHALLVGCPIANNYIALLDGEYNDVLETDIKTIVKLTPQSMNFTLGIFRKYRAVPPLFVACINKEIPLSMIEFLLKSGANPNAAFGKKDSTDLKTILTTLKSYIPKFPKFITPDRYQMISELFKAYGTIG